MRWDLPWEVAVRNHQWGSAQPEPPVRLTGDRLLDRFPEGLTGKRACDRLIPFGQSGMVCSVSAEWYGSQS